MNLAEPFDQQVSKKAFKINRDPALYGSFAEIGAGQEVARQFFHRRGAAGTVAKTMSAYDMTFSDSIYGYSGRYVSEARLNSMLEHEFELLIERLDAKVGSERTFLPSLTRWPPAAFDVTTSPMAGWASASSPSRASRPMTSSCTCGCSIPHNLEQQEALASWASISSTVRFTCATNPRHF